MPPIIYYNVSRTHRSLNKDAPLNRAIERLAPSSHDLSLAAFTINIAESNFRHTQECASPCGRRDARRERNIAGIGVVRSHELSLHRPRSLSDGWSSGYGRATSDIFVGSP
jgi:hypothetical protein